jgi:opacity protein-like surface antigen
MKRIVLVAMMAAALIVPTAAMAAQPADPGGFGQDRAAWIHANSGAAWGAIAADRAGDNGFINQDYMVRYGDLPTGVTPGQLP